ncbi:MAG: RNA pseudouridine synthase [Bacteroidetes bacterium]|nr:RNA pseudouridine synthase [Bacteroidota bacterium]MDA0873745.1 RNA pseudouridine synthase [Bacteroidota bacterium]
METRPLPVRYVDNHLLVIDKPPGMLSQGDETGDLDVLTAGKSWVGEYFNKPGAVFLGLVHRLDRPASGLMVLARTSKSAARLAEQFRVRSVEKRYLAWVEGQPAPSGAWTDWLRKEEREVRVVSAVEPGAKEARLAYDVVQRFDTSTLVAIRLETGRPHQVRLQFASRGFPLTGDIRYGATRELDGKNLALHAAALALDHPTRGQRLGWTSVPGAWWPEQVRSVARDWLKEWSQEAAFGVDVPSPPRELRDDSR